MANFSLKDTINRTNNPTLDGIFEYGRYDLNTLAFTRFDTYGYTDGSPVDYNNIDIQKVLGWHSNGIEYPHLAFENTQGNTTNISPQPFPNFGIYLHPSYVYTGYNGYVGVRINASQNSTLAILPGSSIQAGDTNCGDNISYRIIKNGTTSIIPLTVIPHSSTPTSINLSSVSLLAGDYLDIIIGHGNPSDNEGCDDTALELLVQFTPTKVNTPTIDTFTCSSTSVTTHINLQTEGTVEMYNSSNVLVGTGTIVADGYNGIATITGLNLSSGGSFYFIAKNTGQTDSDPSSSVTISSCCTTPTVTINQGKISICNGDSDLYTTSVTGTTPISYQWFKDNVAISGATNSSLVVTSGGTYRVEVTNSCGTAISTNRTVVEEFAPAGGGVQPSINITDGTPYNHSVTFSGTAPFTLTNVIKPSWLSISLLGNIVTISGTPAISDIGPADYSFDISNSCGVQTSYTIGSSVTASCINVSGGVIIGNSNATVGINETYSVSSLIGDAPFYYLWTVFGGIIASGQGTSSVSLIPTTSNMTIQCTVTNCSGNGSVTLNKSITVKVSCSPTVYVKSNCFTVVGVTGTKAGVVEPNRVTSFTSTTITFTAEVGTHDYTFLLTDSTGIIHSVTFKNIVC